MSPLIVAHFEYFMNTLNMHHRNNTENPFDCPNKYPALQYKGLTVIDSPSGSDAFMEEIESSSDDELDQGIQADQFGGMDQFGDVDMLIDTDEIIN